MTARTYGLYDPLAQALDKGGEQWRCSSSASCWTTNRGARELQRQLPGLGTARLADRLRELRAAGLIEDGYALTEPGEQLAPAIHALTRFGLARLRPLPGMATAYRPSFAAWALRARADAAAPSAGPFASVTHVESESFRTRANNRGRVTTSAGDAGPERADIVRTDTMTAMSLATGAWTLAQARRHGHLALFRTSDDEQALGGGPRTTRRLAELQPLERPAARRRCI